MHARCVLLTGLLSACQHDMPPGPHAGAPELHRLTARQINGAIAELFGDADLHRVRLPSEITVDGFDSDARTRSPTPYLVESLQREISSVVAEVVPAGGAWLQCAPGGGDAPRTCGRETLARFLPRAWRRPVTAAETDWITAAFLDWEAELGFDDAMTLALGVVLQSPDFLYMVERGDRMSQVEGIRALTAWELASRMSFLLWDSMPDEELFAAAESGALRTDAGIRAQAVRMIRDPRSRAAVRTFHRQWLDFDAIQSVNPDYLAMGPVVLQPGEQSYFDEVLATGSIQDIIELDEYWGIIKGELMLAYQAEMDLFVDHVVFEQGTIDALLTSRTGFVTPRTAPLHGLDFDELDGPTVQWAPTGDAAISGLGEFLSAEVKRVEHDDETRAGILTQGAFLAGHSHPTSTSPVLRGVFVRERILCLAPLVPPGDIPPIGATDSSEWTTNRERYAAHSSDPACAACHVPIDGMGFPFEHYDAVGAWRDTDNGAPVDATGALVGTDVDGPVDDAIDVVEALAGSRMVHDCAVEKLWHHAMHRTPSRADTEAVRALQDGFWNDGGVILNLYVHLIESRAFRTLQVSQGEGAR
ncbi:MAG: DUF1592 domain-containing protein [Myxococcota bacterium]|nr:DUF1592 domain-containing protein [Myxococcota bacterium]